MSRELLIREDATFALSEPVLRRVAADFQQDILARVDPRLLELLCAHIDVHTLRARLGLGGDVLAGLDCHGPRDSNVDRAKGPGSNRGGNVPDPLSPAEARPGVSFGEDFVSHGGEAFPNLAKFLPRAPVDPGVQGRAGLSASGLGALLFRALTLSRLP